MSPMTDNLVPAGLSALAELASDMWPQTAAGTPTVAAQVMQRFQPSPIPTTPQMQAQAGTGAQVLGMQQQQDIQAMQRAAQAQRPQMPGPLNLSGGITATQTAQRPQPGYAEGGIVGYSEGGSIYDTSRDPLLQRLRGLRLLDSYGQAAEGSRMVGSRQEPRMGGDERERMLEILAATTPQMPVPDVQIEGAAPPALPTNPALPAVRRPATGGGIATLPAATGPSSAALFDQQQGQLSRIPTGPIDPKAVTTREAAVRAEEDAALRAQDIDPNAVRGIDQEALELLKQQRQMIADREARLRGRDTTLSRVGEAMRGFSQMRGEGLGRGMLGANANLDRRVMGDAAELDRYAEAQLRITGLEIEKRRAIEVARIEAARGNRTKAEQALDAAQKAQAEIEKAQASATGKRAETVSQSEDVRAQIAARAAEGKLNRDIELYKAELSERARRGDEKAQQAEAAMARAVASDPALKAHSESLKLGLPNAQAAYSKRYMELLLMWAPEVAAGAVAGGAPVEGRSTPAMDAGAKIIGGSK